VSALLVGDQAAIERADWDVFRATGVAHLMAISGLHITGLAWLAALCMGQLWRRSDGWRGHRPLSLWLPTPLAASVCGVVVALAYALFTGWGVPAQRTVWMLAVVTLLRWHGKRWPWPQVWWLVCMVVLAVDPWALLQAGFWLSFVAVGVLFVSDARMSEPPEPPPPDAASPGAWPHRLARAVWRALQGMWREQWLMSVCLAPLSLLLFHQISLVGVWANLLAVPWVTLVVTPLCLLGLVWAPLWSWASEALQLLRGVLQGMAALSWAQWSAPAAPSWAGWAAVLGMATWALPVPAWLRGYGLVLVLPVLSWHTPRPSPGQFELLSADMGQGHAVLVRTAHHALLYDTGPRYSAETDAGQRVLLPLLRAWGERLDTVVISHQDSDHSGGAAAVLAMQPDAKVLTSVPADHRLQTIRPMQRCAHGQSWTWDDVTFTVLHPRVQDYDHKNKPNALSCVLRISTPSAVAALLVGDIEAAQERALVQSGEPLKADWLLVPHHGSATSSTTEFVQAVDPRIAVVQAGYRNRFGHPRADVMARYVEQGVHVVQTTRCGASTWQSSQPEMVRCERDVQKRYWHHSF
jgi:competence protein ComEC